MASNYQAIVICGGAPNPALDVLKNKIDIETAFFIGVDRGALFLLQAGLPLSLAVGDFDSVNPAEFIQIKQAAGKLLQSVPEKDDTDMELALQAVVEGLYQAPQAVPIYLVGGLGEPAGRLDHLLANLYLVYQPRYHQLINQLRFIERHHDMRFYQPGTHTLKNQPGTQYLSVITLSPVEGLEIKGAKYTLDSTDLNIPRAYISNEFNTSNKSAQLSFSKGLVAVMWVGETLDHQLTS